jgi:cytochrome d ubiquinol oxidase subunit II
MPTLWFCLIAVMIAVYVLLDGFDLGAGIVHLGVAHTNAERRAVLSTIGPVWDANEVWLIASGGVLFFAFPILYASSFSGFYLPLMMVLWLLILRGVAVEFRSHISGPIWAPFWDVVFCLSSALLAIFYGAALGNVVRGVPLDAQGYFFEPLWTNFKLGQDTGVLDWYTILVGLTAYFALAQHGALWVAHKTEGEVSRRARRIAKIGWWGVAILTTIVTLVTFHVQPHVLANLTGRPWGFIFPAIAVVGLIGVIIFVSGAASRANELRAFLASCAYLLGMLTSVVFGIYPYVLPARGGSALSLTIYNAGTTRRGMQIGLTWWIVGIILATGYFIFLYRRFAGKVGSSNPTSDGHGY